MVFGPHQDKQLTIAHNIFTSFGIDNILYDHVYVAMYFHFRILQCNASLYLLSTIYHFKMHITVFKTVFSIHKP